MDLIGFIILIFVIFLIVLTISIVKKLLKIAIIAIIIFIILFLITGGGIMNDFANIKKGIDNSYSIVLLEKDGKIIEGMKYDKEIHLYTIRELDELQVHYSRKSYEILKGDAYKLIIIKAGVLNELDKVTINEKNITSSQIYNYFIDDKQGINVGYFDVEQGLNFETQNTLRSELFANLYHNNLKITKNPILFFSQFKSGNIIVYPETIFFKFIKFTPLKWSEEKLNKLKLSIEEKVSGETLQNNSVQ